MYWLRFQGWLVGLALIIGCATEPLPPPKSSNQPEHTLQITFINVGQADAILIQIHELDILVDAGRSYSDELQAALETISPPLELMFITHPHLDHYGGARGILSEHEVGAIITNGERRGPPRDAEGEGVMWLQFEEKVDKVGMELDYWPVGTTVAFEEGLRITILAAGGRFPDTSRGSDINNDSLVMMLEYAERRILLTGDIETEAGQMLVEEYCGGVPTDCDALNADILKVPHHGSASFYPVFFEAVEAQWAVIKVDYARTYGSHCLPRKETVEELVGLGKRIKSTNHQGGTDVIATITPEGHISWNIDEPEVFVWDTTGDTCAGETCRIQDGPQGASLDCTPLDVQMSD
ncbi:MAG: ComEC/Rec2 family competence protein [Bradymonadaceae bacterium]